MYIVCINRIYRYQSSRNLEVVYHISSIRGIKFKSSVRRKRLINITPSDQQRRQSFVQHSNTFTLTPSEASVMAQNHQNHRSRQGFRTQPQSFYETAMPSTPAAPLCVSPPSPEEQ